MAATVTLEVVSEVRKATAGIREVSDKLTGLQKIGKSIGPTLKGVLAADLVREGAAAVVDGFKAVVNAGSDLQQNLGGAEAVFGKNFGSIKTAAQGAAQQFGLTQSDYLSLTSVLGAGLKGSGLQDYAGQSQKLVGLGADLAAQFGGSTKDALGAISSFMRGETDPMEKFGVAIKQSDVAARLAATGQDKLTGAALKQAEAQARLSLLFDATKDAQGAFGRESNTWAGVQQRIGAELGNIAATIGTALLPHLTELGNAFAQHVLPALRDLASQAGPAIQTVIGALGQLRPVIDAVFGFIRDNPQTVKAFAITLGILAAAVGIATVAQWAWNVAMTANPIGLIILGIALLVAAIVWVVTNFDMIAAAVGPAWETVKNAVVGAVMFVVNGIMQFFGGIAAWIQGQWEMIVNGSRVIWAAIVGVIRGHVEAVRNGVNAGISWVRNFIDSAFRFLVQIARVQIALFQRYIVDPINKARQLVGTAITNVKTAVSTGLSAAATLGKQAFDRLVASVVAVVTRVIDTVRGIHGRITGALSGIGSWLASAGSNLVRGFVNGITGGIGRAVSAAAEVARAAVNAAKSALGIHSPSRVFRDEVGEQTVAGLVLALKAGRSTVARTTAGLADSMLEAWQPDALGVTIGAPEIAGTSGGRGTPAQIVYQITVEAAALADPVAIGRAVVDAVRAFERAQGRPAPIGGGAR